MMPQLPRRVFIWRAAVGLFFPFALPMEVFGAITTALSYLVAGNPLLSVAALIEDGAQASAANKQSKQLDQIASQLLDIAGNQNRILQELAEQRIVMREEVKRGFLDNDVREMLALAQRFKIAMANEPDARANSLQGIVARADELATKLSTYGLAAVPAYITSIGIENSIHYVLGSPNRVFLAVNETHKYALNDILNGEGPDSLSAAIARNFPTQDDLLKRKQIDKLFTSDLHPVWIAKVTYVDGSKGEFTHFYRYTGFKNGEPTFVSEIIYFPDTVTLRIQTPQAPKKAIAAIEIHELALSNFDYRLSKAAVNYPSRLASDGTFVLQDSTRLLERAWLTAISSMYQRLNYLKIKDMEFGITGGDPRPYYPPLAPTDTQVAVRQLIIEALTAVDKILAAQR